MTCSSRLKSTTGPGREIKTALAALSAALVFLSVAEKCQAGITVGDKPPGMSEEQHYQMAVEEAQKDLERKNAVAQRRFDQKMAYRDKVVKGMQAELEMRRKMIDVAPAPAASAPAKNETDYLGYAIWTLALAVTGTAAFQFWRSRQEPALTEG